MPTHLMVDLETLGTAPTAIPIQIGAVLFDDNFKITGQFYIEPDIADAARSGLTTETDTIAWWMNRGSITQEEPHPLKCSLSLFKSMLEVSAHYGKGKKARDPIRSFWSWGSDFDIPILRNAFRAADLEFPWPYWLTRDARTIHALAFPDYRPARGEVQHNALEDAKDQVAKLEAAFKTLNLSFSQ